MQEEDDSGDQNRPTSHGSKWRGENTLFPSKNTAPPPPLPLPAKSLLTGYREFVFSVKKNYFS